MRVPLSKDTVVTSLEDMENECLLVQARLALKMDDIGKLLAMIFDKFEFSRYCWFGCIRNSNADGKTRNVSRSWKLAQVLQGTS